MKYLFIFLLLTGCTKDPKERCEMANGARMMLGMPTIPCGVDPIDFCRAKCKDHINTNIRIGTSEHSNLFSCSCDDK
jgi:hypothetical protein